ncbi:hypothetical protein FI667_g8880, partial [Globisporangium splendens]
MSTALAAARAKTKGKRMLRDSLEAFGEDEFTISEWNRKKKEAERDGTWMWKQSVANTNATIKTRFEKGGIKDALKARFVGMQDAMDQEMKSVLHAHQDDSSQRAQDDDGLTQCSWRERIGGKPYRCTNDVPVDKKKTKTGEPSTVPQPRVKQFCRWHARECDYDEHPLEKSRAIEIPNELGFCLHCYEATAATQRATLQKTPPRVIVTKIPGVCLADLRRDVKRDMLMSSKNNGKTVSNKLTARSVCSWQKEHNGKAFIWRCTNCVLMHPTLKGSYLSFCGFHAPRCVKEYGRKGKKEEACPPIDRLNKFGMCRNHLEAHLSTLNYEQRGSCILVNTEFDVPGIKECSRDPLVSEVKRHPLAPKHPPPSDDLSPQAVINFAAPTAMEALPESLVKRVIFISAMLVKNLVAGLLSLLLASPNPVSALLKEAIWRFQFLRRAEVVAIRIQRIFRGKRGRRRVHRHIRNSISNNEPTPTPLSLTALEFCSKEFGLDRQQRKSKRVVKPMPERASAIEKRMTELGFKHTAAANRRDQQPGSNEIDRSETGGTELLACERGTLDHVTRDDSALDDYGSRIHSSQDLHRLLYELKNGDERKSSKSPLEVCDRSFAAILRVEDASLSTPLSDQYMHAYWPPQSLWNQETHAKFQHMVGYFRCSHAGCEQVEFQSRRELNSHAAMYHSAVEDQKQFSPFFGETSKSSSSRSPQIIWLGAYTICRSLHEKLGLSNGFEQLAPCQIHTKLAHESCKICVRQQSRPVLPSRLYSAVALTFSSNRDEDYRQLNDAETDSVEYMIFSVQGPEFCPAVHELDLDQDINEKRLQSHSHVKIPGDADDIVYIKIASLCRDANGEEWVLGHAFRSFTSARPGSSRLSARRDVTDRHEVFLDEERLVFTKLCHVIGAARVHHCSKTIAERFWRQSIPNDTPPPSR